jgi:hypothetical protein
MTPTAAATRPDPATLEVGDFLWPKLEGQWVPYFESPNGISPDADRARWEQDRDAYVRRVRRGPKATFIEKERATDLEQMSYADFRRVYFGDTTRQAELLRLSFYTGHVAMVHQVTPDIGIVDATTKNNVKYGWSWQGWLDERPGCWVWHARLKERGKDERDAIARTAVGEHDKVFNIWNFDLGDDREFYCSKLMWYSVWTTLGLALDDMPWTTRLVWFSPKQLMHSPHVDVLFSPGNY